MYLTSHTLCPCGAKNWQNACKMTGISKYLHFTLCILHMCELLSSVQLSRVVCFLPLLACRVATCPVFTGPTSFFYSVPTAGPCLKPAVIVCFFHHRAAIFFFVRVISVTSIQQLRQRICVEELRKDTRAEKLRR